MAELSISSKQRVYQYVLEGLFSGRLTLGSRVNQLAVSKELQISQTPVREALTQLIAEGVLTSVAGVGAFVRRPGPDEVTAICEVRAALEGLAAVRAARAASDGQIRSLQAINDQMMSIARECKKNAADCSSDWLQECRRRAMLADARFHDELLRAAGNRLAMDLSLGPRIWTQILMHSPWSQPRATGLIKGMVASYVLHRRLLSGIRRRDCDAARKWAAEPYRYRPGFMAENVSPNDDGFDNADHWAGLAEIIEPLALPTLRESGAAPMPANGQSGGAI